MQRSPYAGFLEASRHISWVGLGDFRLNFNLRKGGHAVQLWLQNKLLPASLTIIVVFVNDILPVVSKICHVNPQFKSIQQKYFV